MAPGLYYFIVSEFPVSHSLLESSLFQFQLLLPRQRHCLRRMGKRLCDSGLCRHVLLHMVRRMLHQVLRHVLQLVLRPLREGKTEDLFELLQIQNLM